jgi:hypothetical protein
VSICITCILLFPSSITFILSSRYEWLRTPRQDKS